MTGREELESLVRDLLDEFRGKADDLNVLAAQFVDVLAVTDWLILHGQVRRVFDGNQGEGDLPDPDELHDYWQLNTELLW